MNNVQYAYRYEDVQYALYDPWSDGDYTGPGELKVELQQYPIIKRTPKGMWIESHRGTRFVLLTARKKYATLTIAEAKESFLARKRSQLRILQAQVNRVQRAIAVCENKKP